MKFGFPFLERLWAHLDKPSDREFARRLGTYYQRLAAWQKSSGRIREAFQILSRARVLSGQSWNQFGKELDADLKETAPASTEKPRRRAS